MTGFLQRLVHSVQPTTSVVHPQVGSWHEQPAEQPGETAVEQDVTAPAVTHPSAPISQRSAAAVRVGEPVDQDTVVDPVATAQTNELLPQTPLPFPAPPSIAARDRVSSDPTNGSWSAGPTSDQGFLSSTHRSSPLSMPTIQRDVVAPGMRQRTNGAPAGRDLPGNAPDHAPLVSDGNGTAVSADRTAADRTSHQHALVPETPAELVIGSTSLSGSDDVSHPEDLLAPLVPSSSLLEPSLAPAQDQLAPMAGQRALVMPNGITKSTAGSDDIEIRIGRIEVSAAPPAPRPLVAQPRRQAPSLDDYLRRRNARG